MFKLIFYCRNEIFPKRFNLWVLCSIKLYEDVNMHQVISSRLKGGKLPRKSYRGIWIDFTGVVQEYHRSGIGYALATQLLPIVAKHDLSVVFGEVMDHRSQGQFQKVGARLIKEIRPEDVILSDGTRMPKLEPPTKSIMLLAGVA